MPKGCGCSGSSCGCSIVGGSGVAVSGIGTAKDPYKVEFSDQPITGKISVTDSSDIHYTELGSGTVADPYVVSGVLKRTSGSYTPTLTGITLGTAGTVTGSFIRVGTTIHAVVDIVFGSSGYATTGQMGISLPTNMLDSLAAGHVLEGGVVFNDVSASQLFKGSVVANGSATGVSIDSIASALGQLSTALPFTIGAGDKISLVMDYQAAA